MIWRVLLLSVCFYNFALAQQKVLLFSNITTDNASKNILINEAKTYGINLEYSSSLDSISNFSAVFLLDFDEKKLTVKENAALVSFFKNGGGVAATQDIFKTQTSRLWYQQMFGLADKNTQKRADLDLIPVKDLGAMSVSPLWKLSSAYVFFPKIPKFFKPVLVTLEGNAVAWLGNSEFGNRVFLTSIRLEREVLQNLDFTKVVFGGIKEVLSSKKMVNVEEISLPVSSDFGVKEIASRFENAKAFKYHSRDFCLILDNSGQFFNYIFSSKELISLGSFEKLIDAHTITFDPEFETNGYVYFYLGQEKAKVLRIKLLSASMAETDDFESESSFPLKNVILVNADSANIGMPKYYFGRRIEFTPSEGLTVASYNIDNEIIDKEQFVLDFPKDSVVAIDNKENGDMLVLTPQSLKLVQFKHQGLFPPFVNFSYKIMTAKSPFKVEFEAIGRNEDLYEWEIQGKKTVGKKLIQVFRIAGDYKITLKVTDKNGFSDLISRSVKIEKAPIK
jgi:hypothetical protein